MYLTDNDSESRNKQRDAAIDIVVVNKTLFFIMETEEIEAILLFKL